MAADVANGNPILNYEEALLIYNNVAASMRFLRSVERRGAAAVADAAASADDVPFLG